MTRKVHFVGWFTLCTGEGSTVSWKDLGKEYLEEMAILKHGLENIMSAFGETDVVMYFRTSGSVAHHAHVHATPRSEYVAKPSDKLLMDVMDAAAQGKGSSDPLPAAEETKKRGIAKVDTSTGAIGKTIAEAENSFKEENEQKTKQAEKRKRKAEEKKMETMRQERPVTYAGLEPEGMPYDGYNPGMAPTEPQRLQHEQQKQQQEQEQDKEASERKDASWAFCRTVPPQKVANGFDFEYEGVSMRDDGKIVTAWMGYWYCSGSSRTWRQIEEKAQEDAAKAAAAKPGPATQWDITDGSPSNTGYSQYVKEKRKEGGAAAIAAVATSAASNDGDGGGDGDADDDGNDDGNDDGPTTKQAKTKRKNQSKKRRRDERRQANVETVSAPAVATENQQDERRKVQKTEIDPKALICRQCSARIVVNDWEAFRRAQPGGWSWLWKCCGRTACKNALYEPMHEEWSNYKPKAQRLVAKKPEKREAQAEEGEETEGAKKPPAQRRR